MHVLREIGREGSSDVHTADIPLELHLPAPEAVREQLERLLVSPRFATSSRCQILLRFVVEEMLAGRAESLKERHIGIEVFKRTPSYDTNADPVVRVAIGEIRKKLAQYYYEPAHQDQVRIELPTGSYAPIFSLPEPAPARNGVSHDHEEPIPAPVAVLPIPVPPPPVTLKRRPHTASVVLATIAACALVAGVVALAWRATAVESLQQRFWAPVVNSPSPALLVLGQLRATQVQLAPNLSRNPGGAAMPIGKNGIYPLDMPVAVVDDSITLANVAGLLRADKKGFVVRAEGETSYEDLQKGPVVLIGALNNDWTMHLMRTMRFRFNEDSQTMEWWVSDQKNPGVKMGMLKADGGTVITQDLAIVARVMDSETRQPTIIVAGLGPPGTEAGGEFVTNPQYLNDFLRSAPPSWQTKNLEVLLSVNVIDSQPGPPRVLALSIW